MFVIISPTHQPICACFATYTSASRTYVRVYTAQKDVRLLEQEELLIKLYR